MSDENTLLKGNKFKGIAMSILAVIAAILGITKGPEIVEDMTQTTAEQETVTTPRKQTANQEREGQTVDFKTTTTKDQPVAQRETEEEKATPRQVTDDADVGEQILTYHGKDVILTRHAKCRMGCRYISKKEVGEVLEKGKINKRKSNPNDPRCPTVALEQVTSDGQTVRIIVADCKKVAKLVTVIDLKNKYNCVCD